MNNSVRTHDSARAQSGVEGLDCILVGGFPRNRVYLVQGDPGTGKTTLALQFLLEGLRQGEPGLYITLSESREELEAVAASHGWTLNELGLIDVSAVEPLVKADAQTSVFRASELELGNVSDLIRETVERLRPRRVAFDSLSDVRLLSETPLRYRRLLLELKQLFNAQQCTVLVVDDRSFGGGGPDSQVLSLVHGVLDLQQLAPEYGPARRRLEVTKLRGVAFVGGYHDYLIQTGGVRVFPRLKGYDREFYAPRSVASGVMGLDALLGGGIDRGTTTLVMGPAGTGKSSIAALYAQRFAEQGERVLYFSFDETLAIALARARALGLDLEPFVRDGRVLAQQVDPAELSPGEFAQQVCAGVSAGARLVVIDSLNGYLNAMPGERYLYNQLHELCGYLNQRGVATLLVLAQQGLVGSVEAPVDISYLADTVVVLRYFEMAGTVRRAIAVVKRRSGNHEKTIREFDLTPGEGIRVGPPLMSLRGVLTGVPQVVQDEDRSRPL